MFQKEVAERIVAKVNTTNYGRLSIFTSIYANVEILFDVSPQSFLPTPKVFSSVIKLTPKKNSFIDDVLLTKLEKVTNVAFSMRRKMIKQSIKKILNVNLESLNIDENKRPQEVSLEEFIKIANTL
jgi:16S rRNA (adenine1518-N6/adenine1519-N6)-dimethyltransferase